MPKESQLSQRDTEDNVSFSIFFFSLDCSHEDNERSLEESKNQLNEH